VVAVNVEPRHLTAGKTPAAVIAILARKSPLTVPEIRAESERSRSLPAVYQACLALAAKGLIQRVEHGVYASLDYVAPPPIAARPVDPREAAATEAGIRERQRERLLAALEAANYSPSKAATALGITRQGLHKAMVAANIPRLTANEWRALRGKVGAGLEIFLTPRHVAILDAIGGATTGAEVVAMALREGDPVDEAGGPRTLKKHLRFTPEARARLLAVAEAHDVSEAQVFRAALERRAVKARESFLRESAKSG
jgi:hypothetical protein